MVELPKRLFEGKYLKIQSPKVDYQNPQLQDNLTMKAEIGLCRYQAFVGWYPESNKCWKNWDVWIL